jgi:hypothetical protein
MKTGAGPRQSPGLAAVSPPYARANGIRFSGSRALQHRLSVVRLPGDIKRIDERALSVQQDEYRDGNNHQSEYHACDGGAFFQQLRQGQCRQCSACATCN